ncbi:MAG: ATP synthase subunit epsilon, membrane-bound, F1 sector [Candidatus Rokubacteria bacterium CSP1-6]|nr:MAG: ATP synthase subunit epsilon, membrane-bound, F1 sector [Candidatus Rokubacteria bacterium CSP1-6]
MAEPRVRFELATPNRLVVSEDVEEVVAPGLQGYFGVLPGHVPFLTSLQSGEVSYRIGRTEQYLAVSGGFAEVQGDRVTILAERAERPEEIDRERALRARQRAERRLQGKTQEEIDYTRALTAFSRALARLQVAGRGPSR